MKKTLLIISSLLVFGTLNAEEPDIYVAKYKNDRRCAISYTFDDGVDDQYTLAAVELEKRGFRGTFTINGSCINQDSAHIHVPHRMTWEQVKSLSERGHEISNHGWAHRKFSEISNAEIREEIHKNDSVIFSRTGVWPRSFCYPYNNMTAEGCRMAEEDRVITRTSCFGVGGSASPESLDEWVGKLLENRGWGVGMTHGMYYGYDSFTDAQKLWDHYDKVKALEDSIWVGTFSDVAAYIKERDNVRLEISENRKHIVVSPEMTLDKDLFNQSLTLVVKNRSISSARQDGKDLPVIARDGKYLIDFNPSGGSIKIKLI